MREADLSVLAKRLFDIGITAPHAHRAVNELRDHYDDLVDAAVDDGKSSHTARGIAAGRLGAIDVFVAEMDAHRELKTWPYRYPRLAAVVYPLGCLAALPAMPILAGVTHAATLARWGASLLAAGVVTASMLLAMQLSIVLG